MYILYVVYIQGVKPATPFPDKLSTDALTVNCVGCRKPKQNLVHFALTIGRRNRISNPPLPPLPSPALLLLSNVRRLRYTHKPKSKNLISISYNLAPKLYISNLKTHRHLLKSAIQRMSGCSVRYIEKPWAHPCIICCHPSTRPRAGFELEPMIGPSLRLRVMHFRFRRDLSLIVCLFI